VTLAWAFFQPSLQNGLTILRKLVGHRWGTETALPTDSLYVIAFGFLVVHLLAASQRVRNSLAQAPEPIVGAAYAILLYATLFILPEGRTMFIYFTF
jgi:hypothetical protein